MRIAVTAMFLFMSLGLGVVEQGGKVSEKNCGLLQRIPLSFFLGQKLKSLEKALKTTPGGAEVASYWFLKELLNDRPMVSLSASSVRDENGEKIEELCDPI